MKVFGKNAEIEKNLNLNSKMKIILLPIILLLLPVLCGNFRFQEFVTIFYPKKKFRLFYPSKCRYKNFHLKINKKIYQKQIKNAKLFNSLGKQKLLFIHKT